MTSATDTIVITGGVGAEIIVGTSIADSITGAAGADNLTGGTGADVFAFAQADSVARTAHTLTDGGIVNTNTITFGNSLDIITGFVSGTDTINVATAGAPASAMAVDPTTNNLVANSTHQLLGTFTGNVFTVNSAATAGTVNVAVLVLTDAVAADFGAASQTSFVLLMGIAAVAAGDFV